MWMRCKTRSTNILGVEEPAYIYASLGVQSRELAVRAWHIGCAVFEPTNELFLFHLFQIGFLGFLMLHDLIPIFVQNCRNVLNFVVDCLAPVTVIL
jgi:hypothetical protein